MSATSTLKGSVRLSIAGLQNNVEYWYKLVAAGKTTLQKKQLAKQAEPERLTLHAGLDLRRMRNHRGLKPHQLARANGHSSIARQLCDIRTTRTRRDRRRRNAEGGGGGGGGGDRPKATTPEALLTMLIQVVKHFSPC